MRPSLSVWGEEVAPTLAYCVCVCVCERTMYTLEYHHRCIHSVVVIVALSPLPSRCPRTNYAAVPRLSCWLVAHKTHSSKSTNGFRYEMHETDRQTYCAAFLPHRVRVPPPPSPSNPPLCATYIRSYNQLAIFLLTPTLSSSLSLLPVVICDMSSSSKCCFYQPPPPVSSLLLRHCGLRLFGIVEARFMKRIYTISICDTRTSRLASIYTLCRYSRNATPPSAPFPTPFVSISKCILYTRQDTRATFLF